MYRFQTALKKEFPLLGVSAQLSYFLGLDLLGLCPHRPISAYHYYSSSEEEIKKVVCEDTDHGVNSLAELLINFTGASYRD